MPDFRTFSLADSMNGAVNAAAGTINVQNAVRQRDDQNLFRQAAAQAAQGAPAQPTGQPTAQPPAAPDSGPVQLAGPGAEQPTVDPAAAARQPNIPMGASSGGQNAQAINQLFGVSTAGHQKSFDYNYFGRLLESQGRPDLAAGAYKMGKDRADQKVGMQLQLMDFIGRAAPLVTDQGSLDALRQNLSTLGLDGALPQQFTPDLQQQLMMMGSKSLQQLELKLKEKHEASDDKHKRAQEKRWEEQSRIDKEKAAGGGSLKPNDVRMRVADLFGGVYDPMSGRIGGLDKDKTTKALAVMERAERIYADGRGSVTPAEATSQAARAAGIPINSIGAVGPGGMPPFNPKNFMTNPGLPLAPTMPSAPQQNRGVLMPSASPYTGFPDEEGT